MNTFEKPFWNDGKKVCGIDEAGRGPLAGPMVVAGVVLPIGYVHPIINDSKQLSEKKRKLLFSQIMRDAIEVIIVVVDEAMIDKENIYQCAKLAMTKIAKSSIAAAILAVNCKFSLLNIAVTTSFLAGAIKDAIVRS